MRLIAILEVARFSASPSSALAALEAFFAASFFARAWASTERVERFAASTSVHGSQQLSFCIVLRTLTFGVYLLMQVRVIVLKPVFAFLRRAAKLAVLDLA
jgi:hypothetical protein